VLPTLTDALHGILPTGRPLKQVLCRAWWWPVALALSACSFFLTG